MRQFIKTYLPQFIIVFLLASICYSVVFVGFGVLKAEGFRQHAYISLYGAGISLVFCFIMAAMLALSTFVERSRSDLLECLFEFVAYICCMTGAAMLTKAAIPLSIMLNAATDGAAPVLQFDCGWLWRIVASFFYCALVLVVGAIDEHSYDGNLLFGPPRS